MADLTDRMDWFRDDGIFLPMLNDVSRNKFYKSALDIAAPGMIVADVGAGTGILSILAAQAGAKKVFAIEKDAVRAAYLRNMIDKLNIAAKIEIVQDDFLKADIAADIYVSETINTQIFGEDILFLADHARRQGGCFIPSTFEINVEIYEHHPIFVLDQKHPDCFEFTPGINVDHEFERSVNQDLRHRHPLMETAYRANQLNKLFQLLPRFNDVRLDCLWQSQPLIVDLNTPLDLDKIKITVPTADVPSRNAGWYLVLFWKARYQHLVMDCKDVWFGNVSKSIMNDHRTPNTDIQMWYNAVLRDWHVIF